MAEKTKGNTLDNRERNVQSAEVMQNNCGNSLIPIRIMSSMFARTGSSLTWSIRGQYVSDKDLSKLPVFLGSLDDSIIAWDALCTFEV